MRCTTRRRPPHLARSRAALPFLAALLLVGRPAGAQDTEPVVKPVVIATRLPAPTRIVARQTGAGEVTLIWSPVRGAASYVLGRAVGTDGFRRLYDASTGPDTVYVDRQAQAGLRHVYTVTAVSDAGVAGARATSEAVTPTTTGTDGQLLRAAVLTARETSAGEVRLDWSGDGSAVRYYQLLHVLDGRPLSEAQLSSSPVIKTGLAPGLHYFELIKTTLFETRVKVAAASVSITSSTAK